MLPYDDFTDLLQESADGHPARHVTPQDCGSVGGKVSPCHSSLHQPCPSHTACSVAVTARYTEREDPENNQGRLPPTIPVRRGPKSRVAQGRGMCNSLLTTVRLEEDQSPAEQHVRCFDSSSFCGFSRPWFVVCHPKLERLLCTFRSRLQCDLVRMCCKI